MLITFSLFWIVIKNNILYVIRTGDVDGGGLFFPSAINQTFTGLYFLEICLLGLFFLVRDEHGDLTLQAQGVIMAIALILTICYQIWLNLNFSALYQYAPIRLEVEVGRKQREAEEAERLMVEKNEAIDRFDGDASDITSRPTTAELDASWVSHQSFCLSMVLHFHTDIGNFLASYFHQTARIFSISISISSLSVANDFATGRRQNHYGAQNHSRAIFEETSYCCSYGIP